MPQQPQFSADKHANEDGKNRFRDFRDIFSPAKHKRHSSEQKRSVQSQPPNQFGVESPRVANHSGYNSSKTFEQAAKLGLMSQDIPSLSGIISPLS